MSEQNIDSLRELLFRIDERVKNLASTIAEDRAEAQRRETERDVEIKDMTKEIDSLRLSRATVYGGAFGISIISTAIQRMFWR